MHRAPIAAVAMALLLAAAACTTTTSTSTDTDPSDSQLPTDLLHQPGAARKAVDAITEAVGADPAHVGEIDIYGEYMIVEAQDPANAEHIDSYTWRDDDVDAPTPVMLSGPQEEVEAALFSTTAVRWQDIPEFVRAAEHASETATPIRIEEARASYLYVERSTSADLDGRVVIRISISGPRRSGSVEMTASGEILNVSVS
jgi:hypothetical protein